MAIQVQLRRGTAAQWASINPVLGEGELCAELDTQKFKIGNGVSAWNSLPYSSGPIGPTGAQGVQGNDGNFGGASFDYTFDTNVVDSDPGPGKLKFNNASLNVATIMRIDDLDDTSSDIQEYVRGINNSSASIKGHFRISKKSNLSVFGLFTIASISEEQGFFNIGCSFVSGSSFTPFINSEDILITFARTGIQGAQGIQGPQGVQGPQGIQGPTGTQGVQGIQGAQGLKGDQGIQGPIGNGFPFIITTRTYTGNDTTTTFPISANLSVSNLLVIVNNTILRPGADYSVLGTNLALTVAPTTASQIVVREMVGDGPTGPAGPASIIPGPQGPIGDQGIQGAQGPTGATGAASTIVGPTGSIGLQGPTGAQGLQGLTGLQGAQGPTGPVGTTPYSMVTESFTANGSTNTFTINAGLTANTIFVVVNGVVIRPTTDYTVSGTTLTITSPTLNSGAQIIVRELLGDSVSAQSIEEVATNAATVYAIALG
jgi:hypothetical protein